MARLFNDPAHFSDQAITGFVAANRRWVRPVRGGVARSTQTPPGQVAVVASLDAPTTDLGAHGRVASVVDGAFSGRFAHRSRALAAVVEETQRPTRPSQEVAP